MKLKELFTGNADLLTKSEKSIPKLLQKNIKEILVMSEYASGKGIILSDPLPDQIAHLASLTVELDITLKTPIPAAQKIEETTTNLKQYESDLALSIRVHNQLSNLISPVSAASLIATQPGIFKHNKIMKISLIFTIISLILLIGNLFFSEILTFAIKDADYQGLISGLLNYTGIVFAATLGSGVYSLYTARKYLIERTFEPKYNSVYTLRFVLGIALGTILGLFGDELGFTDSEHASIIAKLGPVVLAIVGAFSSDAVVSILQRVAETLQVVVKGSGQSMVELETEKAKNQEKNKAMKLLLDIKNQVSSEKTNKHNLIKVIDKYIAE
jgi:hypothetical protein